MATARTDSSQAPILDKSVPCWTREGQFNGSEILSAFHEDGYVVVRDVFPEEMVERSLDEIWTSPQVLGRNGGAVQRDDPRTWGRDTWPQSEGERNFLEPLDVFQVRAPWELMQHRPVSEVLQLLWHEHQDTPGESLFVPNLPRFGVMRPTKHNPEWKTDAKWLHWDQNPHWQPGFFWIQAFAQLSDGTDESGGLLLVPGAHKEFAEWGLQHPRGTIFHEGVEMTDQHGAGKPFLVPENDPLQQQVRRVIAPAGSLVLWDSRIPHQNWPNTSANDFRFVMYLSFTTRSLIGDSGIAEIKERNIKKTQVMNATNQTSCYWPQKLTELGAELSGAPSLEEQAKAVSELTESLVQAISLTVESGEDEQAGRLKEMIEKQRLAEKKFPRIMDWHCAIFS